MDAPALLKGATGGDALPDKAEFNEVEMRQTRCLEHDVCLGIPKWQRCTFSLDSAGPSSVPVTQVPALKPQRTSGARLPIDLTRRVRDLMQELNNFQSHSGPSQQHNPLELCVKSTLGVLQHLSMVSDLDDQPLCVTYESSAFENSEEKVDGLCSMASNRGSPVETAVGSMQGTAPKSQRSRSFTSSGRPEARREQLSEEAEAIFSVDADFSMQLSSLQVECGEQDTESVVQQVWHADIGSRRGSFSLQAGREVGDTQEMRTSDNKYYLHPESPLRLGWDFTSMILILALSVLIPLEVCFFWDQDPPAVLVVFSTSLDMFFCADIILNFFTAYHEGHGISGRLVTDFRGIAKHYAKSWLWIDIGASMPWLEVITALGGASEASMGSEAMGMLKVLRYAKVARLMKVLRVLKLGGLMQMVEEKMVAAQSMTVAFQLLKMTVVMMVISHNVACGWYAVAIFSQNEEGSRTTWLQAEGLDRAKGWEQYIAAFYFAITTGTTVGYGDIHPTNTLEQAITTFVLVLSVGYIGQFLARVSQMVSSLRSLETQMVQSKRDALLFMKKRSVQKELQYRVLRYIEHVYETDAITALDEKIMSILSESLKNQLALAVTGNVLKQFPLFEYSEENFLTAICQVCRTQRAGVGDTIVAEESAAHEMFWVVRGEAAVLRHRCHVGGLRTGDWFGELSLFFPGAVRKATVRCETNCEFLVLHYDDFQKKVELFPNVRRECDRVAAELRKGNPRVLKIACQECGSLDHFTRDCPRVLVLT